MRNSPTDTSQSPPMQVSFVDKQIERLRQEMAERENLIQFIESNREAFEEAAVRPNVWGSMIDFDHPDRTEILRIIKAFPGKWDKKLNESCEGSIDYIRRIEGEPTLRIWAGELPPCCKLVEVEIDVPAHKRTVRKVVCPEPLQEVAP